MKTYFLIFAFVFTAAPVFAEPPAPDAQQVAAWSAYPKPVHLKIEKITDIDDFTLGTPIWVCGYASHTETPYSYIIGLYKAGTLFGGRRATVEQSLKEVAARFHEAAKHYSGKDSQELAKIFQVQIRPDGREVYFGITGFGPGGGGYLVFTTIGQYDLLLEQIVDSDEAMPKQWSLVKPAAGLPDIYKKLEKFITDEKPAAKNTPVNQQQ